MTDTSRQEKPLGPLQVQTENVPEGTRVTIRIEECWADLTIYHPQRGAYVAPANVASKFEVDEGVTAHYSDTLATVKVETTARVLASQYWHRLNAEDGAFANAKYPKGKQQYIDEQWPLYADDARAVITSWGASPPPPKTRSEMRHDSERN